MAKLRAHKLAPALGAEIEGMDLGTPLGPATVAEFKRAWREHLVLRIRGQQLSDDALLAFSRSLGEIDPPGPNPYGAPFLPEHPEINVISNVKVAGKPIGNLGDGEAAWHADMTYVERPPMGAALYALEVPEHGGDTYWSNMYLAYETLPERLRHAIRGRSAIHDSTYNSAGMMRKGMKEISDPREAPGARHPLVAVHPETERAALYLGRRRNSYILGLDLPESEALLDELWQHATQTKFTFRQVWQKHDLILWDNRCTLHRRDAFDPESTRIMHRTQIRGDAPRA
jgi:taurine dioxygenase